MVKVPALKWDLHQNAIYFCFAAAGGRVCGGLRTVACEVGGPCVGCAGGRLARVLEAEKSCGLHPDEHYVARLDAAPQLLPEAPGRTLPWIASYLIFAL